MAAVASIFTIARVAEMLGEDEDWLREISIGDDYVLAFTDYGIQNLCELVWISKDEARRRSGDQPQND